MGIFSDTWDAITFLPRKAWDVVSGTVGGVFDGGMSGAWWGAALGMVAGAGMALFKPELLGFSGAGSSAGAVYNAVMAGVGGAALGGGAGLIGGAALGGGTGALAGLFGGSSPTVASAPAPAPSNEKGVMASLAETAIGAIAPGSTPRTPPSGGVGRG